MARSALHEAARAYAARGWYVFPIEEPRDGDPKSGKEPKGLLVPNGWHDATCDLARVDQWWGRFPHLGIGIALEPSGLVVLDIDSVGVNKKDGSPKVGAQSLAELEAEIGTLGPTRLAETGSGGHHGFFARDAFPIAGSKISFLKNLDLIVNGYVVAPPSPHYSGGTYRWVDEREPALLPRALVERAQRSRVKTVAATADTGREKVGEGGRNASMFRLACAIRDTGLGGDALRAAMALENEARFDPPMDESEVAEIVEKVLARVVPSRDVALGAVVAQEALEVARKLAAEAAAVDENAPWFPPLAREVAIKPQRVVRYFATGVADLDAKLGGGLPDDEICGIVGPPSCGKSAFVGTLAEVLSRNMPLVHFSTELTTAELTDRYAALLGELVWRDIRRGAIPRARVVELVRDLNVYVIGCDDLFGQAGPSGDVDHVANMFGIAARVGDRRGAPPGVVIDHMGVLSAGGDKDNVRQRAGELTMKVRVMTQALHTVTICVYPTQREMYGVGGTLDRLRKSDDPSVFLTAAKESGDIEYHCATILYTDVDKAMPGPLKPARLAIARARQGDIGFVGMRARLDVGKWWGDPSAIADMAGIEARARTNREKSDLAAIRMYDIIERNPGRKWVDLVPMFGLGREAATSARAKLLEAGRIERIRKTEYSALSKPYDVEVYVAVANKDPRRDVPMP